MGPYNHLFGQTQVIQFCCCYWDELLLLSFKEELLLILVVNNLMSFRLERHDAQMKVILFYFTLFLLLIVHHLFFPSTLLWKYIAKEKKHFLRSQNSCIKFYSRKNETRVKNKEDNKKSHV